MYIRNAVLSRLVFSAAVIWVVTQRFSPVSGGEALRDDLNNGCGGDYVAVKRYLV